MNKAAGAALAGMSHGNSGILPGLVKLDSLLEYGRYKETVVEMLRYEKSLYQEEFHNWADLRQEGPGRYHAYAWCHGLGGIAAARMACLPYVEGEVKELITEDLNVLKTVSFLCKGEGECAFAMEIWDCFCF